MIIPFYHPKDKILVRSDGCYQYDLEGNRYLDFESGVWCANLGHNHERVVKAMKKQLDKSIHHGYQFRNKEAEKLALKLQDLIGFEGGGSVFLSSGSEAVNLAIMMARKLTGRTKILKIDHSYLSAFGPGHMDAGEESQIKIPINDYEALSRIPLKEVSAFVVETGGASAGVVRFPEQDFLFEMVQRASGSGSLIVADEVTTGMGRTREWFGYQHYGFVPDIVVTGKALGNGYPISAVTVNKAVLKDFEKASFRYMQSHQNDPLGCAAGLEVIEVIEDEGLIEQSNLTGDYFKQRLKQTHEKYPDLVADVRGRGLMLALEFVKGFDGRKIQNQLFQQGFITGLNQNTLRFMPPLVVTKEMIDLLIDHLEELLDQE